jgi:uncharacterized repeat protein (TIGR03803 family)
MRPSKIVRFCSVLIFALASFCASAVAQSRERVLFVFTYPAPDCFDAVAPLVADAAGNLYGTTLGGGAGEEGCIFELSPSNNGWEETVIYNFSGGDGAGPASPLAFDRQGNLYGTTERGGTYDAGVAFELSPSSGGVWTETVLHNFGSGDDGTGPQSNLVFDSAGNLYGTTTGTGGTRRGGTVFKLTPGVDGWTETILYSFPASISGPDGDIPIGGVVMDGAGNLYGNTEAGGATGYGAVYELAPLQTGGYQESLIYSFNGYDGYEPSSGIVMDHSGKIYGTTTAGGYTNVCGCGLVFELKKNSDGKWTEGVLHVMKATDGGYPVGPVVFDGAGNLYAAAQSGGTFAQGTIFMLTPTPIGPWNETILHQFDYQYPDGKDGEAPYAGVIVRAGRVFGTTDGGGGPDNSGIVFELTPRANKPPRH